MSKVQSRFHPSLLKLLRQIKFNSLGFFFVSFITPIIAYLNLEVSGFQVGLLISIQVFGVMLSSPFAGRLADRRYLRPKLAATGSFGRMLSYLIIYGAIIVENYWLMLLGTFALGFGAGFFWTPLRAIVSDATEYQFRSEAFGIFNQQIGFGTFYGAFIGFSIFFYSNEAGMGTAALYFGLLLYSIANFYAGIQIARLGPRVPLIDTIEQKIGDNTTFITSNRGVKGLTGIRTNTLLVFTVLLVLLFVENLVGSLVAPFLEVFLLENISNDPANVALAYAPGGFISMMTAPTLGRWADKVKPRYWLSATSLIGAVTTWLLINSTRIEQFAVLFIVDATIISSAGLVLSKTLSDLSKDRRGSVFGLEGFIVNLGGITGPLVGGVLWDFGDDRAPFMLSILAEALLAIMYLVILWFFIFQVDQQKDAKEISKSLNVGYEY